MRGMRKGGREGVFLVVHVREGRWEGNGEWMWWKGSAERSRKSRLRKGAGWEKRGVNYERKKACGSR